MATTVDQGLAGAEVGGAVVNGITTSQPAPIPGSKLEVHYNELLKVVEDIGKDVKPAYTTSKIPTDKLRKNITIARGILRECMSDLEKLASSGMN